MKSGTKPALKIGPDKILDFLGTQRSAVGIRNIMIGVGTKDRENIKKAVKKLEKNGRIKRIHGKKYTVSERLPSVTVIEVTGTDENGDAIASPVNWNNTYPPPQIYLKTLKRGKLYQSALGRGDRCLARLQANGDNSYNASIIKRINITTKTILGIFEENSHGGVIKPTDRKYHFNFAVTHEELNKAKSGDLVVAEILPKNNRNRSTAKIIEVLNLKKTADTKYNQPYTKIALYEHNIPFRFSDLAISEAERANPPQLEERDDLRNIPLITIDDEDARDFDDAVYAEPDTDNNNSGGWHLMVAIADVAWFVRPNSELDKTAFERGNSVYFPDQVIPMLPEELSNGLCSLKPKEERPCLAVHIWINTNGQILRHKFVRGLMKSHARLTYNQVQAAIDGTLDDLTAPLFETVIKSLYGAYQALSRERSDREPLDLEFPEKRIILDKGGKLLEVQTRLRHDSHKLIEEFMIAANVAAATTLEKERKPCLYRVHDEPPAKNLESYRDFLKGTGVKLSKGQVLMPRNFNQILKQAKDGDFYDAISQMTLRSQSQAIYTSDNIGHFGLALRRYCHFTSPIRRYSDLIIHRSLISGLNLGAGALKMDPINTEEIGAHLSITERRAAIAERDVINRFSADYLSSKVGETFDGKISGVTKFGLFVTLNTIAVDGLVPIRSLTDDYYDFDEKRMALKGSRNRKVFYLGMVVQVILKESNPISGALVLEIQKEGKFGVKSKNQKKQVRKIRKKPRKR